MGYGKVDFFRREPDVVKSPGQKRDLNREKEVEKSLWRSVAAPAPLKKKKRKGAIKI